MTSSSDPLSRFRLAQCFEAKTTGRYAVKMKLSSYEPETGHLPIVKLLAFTANGNASRTSTLRKLAEFELQEERRIPVAPVDLQGNHCVSLRQCLSSADQSTERLAERLQKSSADLGWEPRKTTGYQRSDRGWSWWDRIQKIKNQPGFSAENFDPESKETKEFALKMARTAVNLFRDHVLLSLSRDRSGYTRVIGVWPLASGAKVDRSTPSDFTH